ncbi:MAG: hypothetical protein GY699_10555 [Desulfobacteraceae bacterium]|nr:hypothetical protein [Desulfobacteraceae bacterium]
MKLIIFIHQGSSTKGENFKNTIGQNLKKSEIQVLQTFNSFKTRLKQVSNYAEEIFILFVDSEKRLTELTSLIDLIENRRVILVLPNKSKVVLSMAHHFFPRYFTYVNDTYTDLFAVINKMKKKINTN